jgi:hypothetical protein
MERASVKNQTHTFPRVAAALLAERRRIAMAFRAAEALEPARAATLQTLALRHDAPFEDLLKLKVIHQTEQRTTFWFDESRYESMIERPRFRTIGMVFVLAIAALFFWALIGVMSA